MKTFGYGGRDRNQPVITSCIVLSEEGVEDGRDGSVLKPGESMGTVSSKDWKEAMWPGSRQGTRSLRKPQDAGC